MTHLLRKIGGRFPEDLLLQLQFGDLAPQPAQLIAFGATQLAVGAAAGTLLLVGAFRGADPAAQGLVIDTEFTADIAQRAARRPDQFHRVPTEILGIL